MAAFGFANGYPPMQMQWQQPPGYGMAPPGMYYPQHNMMPMHMMYPPQQFAPAFAQPQLPPQQQHYSIDVECVATSTQHNGRAVAQIALVDSNCQTVLSVYVKPTESVVSYLTPLTSLTKELLDSQGIPLQEALALVRSHLPKSATLVGHNIMIDVQWLGLVEGVDFAGMVDLAGLWRVWNTKYKTWSVFGQDHIASCLLKLDPNRSHDACADAVISMQSFQLHSQLQAAQGEALQQAKQVLLDTQVAPSFARRNPTFEGCCMGNRKTCKCGAPFFG